jgi:beta-xylosidase
MVLARPESPRDRTSTAREIARVPVTAKTIHLRADCNFRNRTDRAKFYYSLDGQMWSAIGNDLRMAYTIPHFMGYRFGLFCYATKGPGGAADFDFFRLDRTDP